MNEMISSSLGTVSSGRRPCWRRSRLWTVGLAAPLLLLAGLLAVFWGATPALAVDVKVGSGCGGFATIQEGVDNASPGDVVAICAGTYTETNLKYDGQQHRLARWATSPCAARPGRLCRGQRRSRHLQLTSTFTGNVTIEKLDVTSASGGGDCHRSFERCARHRDDPPGHVPTTVRSAGDLRARPATACSVSRHPRAISNAGSGVSAPISSDWAASVHPGIRRPSATARSASS